MQAEHTFDNYFGTYPGANGVPPGTCLPLDTETRDPAGCVAPYPIGNEPPEDLSLTAGVQRRQYDDGRMDGFVAAYRRLGRDGTTVMGYYDAADLPFYWNVADRFTLFDNFFSSARVGARLNHFYWVAGVPTPSGRAPAARGLRRRADDLRPAHRAGRPVEVLRREPRPRGELPHPPGVDDPRPAAGVRPVPRRPAARRPRGRPVASTTATSTPERCPSVAYVVANGSSENPPARLDKGQDLVRDMAGELRQEPLLVELGVPVDLQRRRRVVRPRATADGRRRRLRVPGAGAHDQSVLAPRRGEPHARWTTPAILRFIEDNWQVAPLGTRDASSPGLGSAFDFTAPPRPPELVGTDRTPPPVNTRARWVVYSSYGGMLLIAVAAAVIPGVVRRRRAVQGSER